MLPAIFVESPATAASTAPGAGYFFRKLWWAVSLAVRPDLSCRTANVRSLISVGVANAGALLVARGVKLGCPEYGLADLATKAAIHMKFDMVKKHRKARKPHLLDQWDPDEDLELLLDRSGRSGDKEILVSVPGYLSQFCPFEEVQTLPDPSR